MSGVPTTRGVPGSPRTRKAEDAGHERSPDDVGVEPDMDETIIGDDEPSLKASTVAPPGGPQSDVQARL